MRPFWRRVSLRARLLLMLAVGFGFDVFTCRRCGRAMRLIVVTEAGQVSRPVLPRVGEATDVPTPVWPRWTG